MTAADYIAKIAKEARVASRELAGAPTHLKNAALLRAATLINKQSAAIISANEKDMQAAKKNDLAPALLDRLELTKPRIEGMIESLEKVASLDDPIGAMDSVRYMPSGIKIGSMRVPLGVVGIIYESRPNVTIEAASLSLKSGNACILRGGSEAFHSNQILSKILREALDDSGLPAGAINQMESTDRNLIGLLIGSTDYLDVLIPRGGKGLIERISKESKVNVIKHLDGNCHVYVDKHADIAMAVKIAINAKTRRYGVCNAMESLLVHKDVAQEFLPKFANELAEHKVEIRGCDSTQKLLKDFKVKPAVESDWSEEYLAPILAIKVVDNLQEAINHINQYGSMHTDAIVTDDKSAGERFIQQVDSSSVMWNASTGFADGFEYGLGAEVGISTDKFHARGPVGLEGLTTKKYVVVGDGAIRP